MKKKKKVKTIEELQSEYKQTKQLKDALWKEGKPFNIQNEMTIIKNIDELSPQEQKEYLMAIIVANNMKKTGRNRLVQIQRYIKERETLSSLPKEQIEAIKEKKRNKAKLVNQRQKEKRENLSAEAKTPYEVKKKLDEKLQRLKNAQKISPTESRLRDIENLEEQKRNFKINTIKQDMKKSKLFYYAQNISQGETAKLLSHEER
jgi:hypothetical protein